MAKMTRAWHVRAKHSKRGHDVSNHLASALQARRSNITEAWRTCHVGRHPVSKHGSRDAARRSNMPIAWREMARSFAQRTCSWSISRRLTCRHSRRHKAEWMDVSLSLVSKHRQGPAAHSSSGATSFAARCSLTCSSTSAKCVFTRLANVCSKSGDWVVVTSSQASRSRTLANHEA